MRPGFPPQVFPSHSLLSHIPSICLWAVNKNPRPGIVPQSLNSSSQPLSLPGDLVPVQGVYSCGKDCLIPIPFRLPQISCLTLSLKCFSTDSDSCPDVGIGPLLQFPNLPRAGPILLTLLFFPLVLSSYQLLCGSLYSFLWSGTPGHSQLVFCMHFCVLRYILDISVERDVLHVHLLFCYLVLPCTSNQ